MKVINPTMQEVVYRQIDKIIFTNPLMMNDYWTTLFNTARGLLDEKDIKMLDMAIMQLEQWLSDDFNTMTLEEAEVLMFQNMDLKSGFEVNGEMITQQEILRRLQQIKNWLQRVLYSKYLPQIRFTQRVPLE